MIERIISDCEQALEHELYFAALNLALTLVDICAKAEYPKEKKNSKRYIDWYEEYIGQFEKSRSCSEMPYPSGKVIYSLRCSMLHQGTPNVEENKCNITKFELIVEKKKENGVYACQSRGFSEKERELSLNVRTLCWKICRVAKEYYKTNKERFDFFNYHLIDWDEVIAQRNEYYDFLEKGEIK